MGKYAVKISKLDVPQLIKTLNAALAEEWLAYYQYWIGARLMEGPMRSEIEPELLKHAKEELNHAEKLANRIIQLEGTPITNPKDWFSQAGCTYEAPNDPFVETILMQNLRGERCAIQRYEDIANLTDGKDYDTFEIAISILKEELEHEEDIESWMKDLNRTKEEFKKIKMA